MSAKYLLTAFSKDRIGIVADISQVVYENGFNLQDSSMTYLAGEFAILLQLSAPAAMGENEVMEILTTECRRLEREKNITAYIRPLAEREVHDNGASVVKTITVEGLDQAGIVYKVSKYLADSRINIRTLDSEVKPTPQSGSDFYMMKIVVDIPIDLPLQKVEDGLGQIGDELNVDITLQ